MTKITICTNTETLRPMWGDIFDAFLESSHDWDEPIAAEFVKAIAKACDDNDCDYEYESSFQYWHGGPGSAPVNTHGYEWPEWLSAALREAEAMTRQYAKEDIAEMIDAE